MTEKNYITLQGFMLMDENLRGNDLILYALIYGMTQDGETQFRGSLKYMSEALHISKRAIQNILAKLESMGYLRKVEIWAEGVKYCNYVAIVKGEEGMEESSILWKKVRGGIEETSMGYRKKFVGGIEKSSTHNNSIDNKIDNYNDNILPIIPPTGGTASKGNTFDLSLHTDEFRDTWEVLLRQPKWRKKSADALKGSLKKLETYEEGVAIAMMQNTINNGWQGLFDLKPGEMKTLQDKTNQAFIDQMVEDGRKTFGW